MIDKKALFEKCKNLLLEKIAENEKAMNAAQEAANTEEKSSMGDKYETGRAMSQLARDMNAKQLFENRQELNTLLKIENIMATDKVVSGCMVQLNNQKYYIAVGLGKIEFNNEIITVLSAKAPLAKLMLGLKVGQEFNLNNKTFKIEFVF